MDIHSNAQGTKAQDVADAHLMDVEVQAKYGVQYLTYWFNEDAGRIFCLCEAPDKQAAENVHREAHGLVADQLIEVEQETVDAFLARSPANSGAFLTW